jgi:cobalt-zinc-cadmium efflux system outer membrane protein
MIVRGGVAALALAGLQVIAAALAPAGRATAAAPPARGAGEPAAPAALAPITAMAAKPPQAQGEAASSATLVNAAGPGETLTLEQAFDVALAANRALAAARLARPVAGANLAVAGERPNPDLLLEDLRETPHQAATLSLPVETAGKRRLRIAAAEADAASGEADIARTAAGIRNRVRRAFYTLLAGERRLAENQATLELARRAAAAAQQRFTAGAAPRLEALQGELTVAQAGNDLEASRGLLAAARSDLDTLLGRPPQDALTPDGDLAAGAVPEAPAAVATALGSSTALALLDRRIAAQKARVALARANQTPNPTLQGALTHGAAPEFDWGWRGALGITLPIFTRHQPEVDVETATLAQQEAERAAEAAQIAGEVTAGVAQAAAARGQMDRFRNDVLPRALAVEDLAEESYRAGETGLVALLQALQSTRDLRLRAIQAGLDYQLALADLEQALGAPLP